MPTLIKLLLLAALSAAVASPSFAQESATGKPVVYLTFDDGPSADNSTDRLLDVLARYGVKATFFVTGQRAAREPDKIAAILYAGHALGNHSHSHTALVGQSSAGIESEFTMANDAVLAAGGPPLTCYRAPFGLADRAVKQVGLALGMTQVKWSVDTRDWQGETLGEAITESLSDVVDGSIVLMHDGPAGRAKTINAVEGWLGTHSHLYRFNALPQCKPYGASEVFANVDDQEADLALEPENIQSLLEKLRSYRFNLQFDGPEQERAVSLYGEQLTSRMF